MARQRSLRLRTRVTLFFALIALFAGSVLIGVTYGFARSNLLAREDSSARDQAIVNASQVREEYTAAPGQIGSFFDADLRTADGGFASLLAADTSTQIAGSDTRVRIDDYPASLVDTVRRGGNGRQYAVINGEDYVVVGLYIGAHDAAYFEAFPLSDT
ncbi:MAG: hypothetical protein P8L16_00640, partial [Ilumatobacter sp.]|nr:hypothetical protein [Ilumatobacter sp.]